MRLTKTLSGLTGHLLHKGGHEALIAATNQTEEVLFELPKLVVSEEDDDDDGDGASSARGSGRGSRQDNHNDGAGEHDDRSSDGSVAPMMQVFLQNQIKQYGSEEMEELPLSAETPPRTSADESLWPGGDDEPVHVRAGGSDDMPPLFARPSNDQSFGRLSGDEPPFILPSTRARDGGSPRLHDNAHLERRDSAKNMFAEPEANNEANEIIQLQQNTRANMGIKKASTATTESISIVSFNQLILLFPMVESGFTLLRSEFNRIAAKDVTFMNEDDDGPVTKRRLRFNRPTCDSHDDGHGTPGRRRDRSPRRNRFFARSTDSNPMERSGEGEEREREAPKLLSEPQLVLLLQQLKLNPQDADVASIMSPWKTGEADKSTSGKDDERNDGETPDITFPQLATSAGFLRLVALNAEKIKAQMKSKEAERVARDKEARRKSSVQVDVARRAAGGDKAAQHAELVLSIWRASAILNDSFDLLDKRKKGTLTIAEFKAAISGEYGVGGVLVKLMSGKTSIQRVDFLLCMLQWGDVVDENELEPDDDAEGDAEAVQARKTNQGGDGDDGANSSAGAVRGAGDSFMDDILSALRVARNATASHKSRWKVVRCSAGAHSLYFALQFWLKQCGNHTPLEEILYMRLVETNLIHSHTTSSEEHVEQFFDFADTNGSGAIDFEEFLNLMMNVKLPVPISQQRKLFDFFARHADGKEDVITFEDFKTSIGRIESRFKERSRSKERNDLVYSMNNVGKLTRYIVVPGSRPHRRWHLSLIFISAYYTASVPYTIAFLRFDDPPTFSVLVPMYTADVILFMNVVRKFFTAFTNEHSIVELSLTQIRDHYLKGDFFFDLVSMLPLDLVVWIVGGSFAAVSWLRLVRMIRFRDVWRQLEAASDDLQTSPIKAELTFLAVFVGVIFHLCACTWFLITVPDGDVLGSDNWVTHSKLHEYSSGGYGSGHLCEEGSSNIWIICALASNEYMLCLYWVVGQLTTIGAGSLLPMNVRERFFMMGLMVLNLSFCAYVLGAISNLFMSADEKLVETRREITSVEQYIASKHLPSELQDEVREIFEFKSRQMENGVNEAEETAIFQSLSQALQVEVAQYIGRQPIARTQTFKGCGDNFLDILSTHLREVTMPPGAILFNQNDISKQLHIIFSGVVELFTRAPDTGEESIDGRPSDGDVLAPLPFFFNVRHAFAARTANNNSVRIFVLERDNYKRLIKLYPDEEETVSQNVLEEDNDGVGDNKSVKSGTSSKQSSALSGMSGESGAKSSAVSGDGDGASSDAGSKASTAFSGFDDKQRNSIAKAINQARKKKENERVCAMCSAAFDGNLEELKTLLAGGDISINSHDYDLRTPFHLAASEGHIHVVMWLLEIEADPSGKDRYGGTPMADAVRHKQDKVIDILRANGQGLDNEDDAAGLLCFAASRGDCDQLRRLIDSRVDPNVADYDGRTALSLAASEGHLECIEYLLSRFADINPVDRWKGTPLTDAIRHKHVPAQDLLRKHGATLPTSDDMACQLCEFAFNGDTTGLMELVHNGVDVNLGDYDDRRALHLACCQGHLGTTEFLLACDGIDVNVVDRLGGTPLEDAHREGHVAIEALLVNFGAVRSGDASLADRIKVQEAKAAERDVEKAANLTKAQRLLERQASVHKEMRTLTALSFELSKTLHERLEALTLTLHPRGARTAKAFKLCPKPSLAETLLTFRDAFVAFMQRHHAHQLLECYLACAEFNEAASYDKLFAIHEEYIAAGSRHALNLPPQQRKTIGDALDGGESDVSSELLFDVASGLEEQLGAHLKKFHTAKEFRAEYLAPLGRLWRVLKLASESTDTTRRLENDVLGRLVELSADETILSFGASVSEQLQGVVEKINKECTDVRDLARRAAAAVKVLYEASLHRSKLMMGASGGVAVEKKGKKSKSGSGEKDEKGGGGTQRPRMESSDSAPMSDL